MYQKLCSFLRHRPVGVKSYQKIGCGRTAVGVWYMGTETKNVLLIIFTPTGRENPEDDVCLSE